MTRWRLDDVVRRGSVVMWLVLASVSSGAQATQDPWYRPLRVQDMVKSVGTNPDGMPTDVLPQVISTYATYVGDSLGVGLAVRLREDPEGAVFVGWRSPGALWRSQWIEDDTIGRLETIRPVGTHYAIGTRLPDGRSRSLLLDTSLSAVTTLDGDIREATAGAAPDAPLMLVVERGTTRVHLTCLLTDAPGRRCQ